MIQLMQRALAILFALTSAAQATPAGETGKAAATPAEASATEALSYQEVALTALQQSALLNAVLTELGDGVINPSPRRFYATSSPDHGPNDPAVKGTVIFRTHVNDGGMKRWIAATCATSVDLTRWRCDCFRCGVREHGRLQRLGQYPITLQGRVELHDVERAIEAARALVFERVAGVAAEEVDLVDAVVRHGPRSHRDCVHVYLSSSLRKDGEHPHGFFVTLSVTPQPAAHGDDAQRPSTYRRPPIADLSGTSVQDLRPPQAGTAPVTHAGAPTAGRE